MKVAIDIGGVLSKRPDVFIPLVEALIRAGHEVYILTDISDKKLACELVRSNGYNIKDDHIICADYSKHGEHCKAVELQKLKADLFIDDHPAYMVDAPCASLFMWPDPTRPYYHKSFKTKDGNFGRTVSPSLKRRRTRSVKK